MRPFLTYRLEIAALIIDGVAKRAATDIKMFYRVREKTWLNTVRNRNRVNLFFLSLLAEELQMRMFRWFGYIGGGPENSHPDAVWWTAIENGMVIWKHGTTQAFTDLFQPGPFRTSMVKKKQLSKKPITGVEAEIFRMAENVVPTQPVCPIIVKFLFKYNFYKVE